jgi:hypothetical protein
LTGEADDPAAGQSAGRAESSHQLLQQDFVSYGYVSELGTKALGGGNVSHDGICPHVSTGHFKCQPEF